MAAKSIAGSRDVGAELAYLTRALKAPTLREAIDRLAEHARTEPWSYEEFLARSAHRDHRRSGAGAGLVCWHPGRRPPRSQT